MIIKSTIYYNYFLKYFRDSTYNISVKQPVLFNFNRIDFNNTKNVINNIEKEFKEQHVLKDFDQGILSGTESDDDGEDFDSKMNKIVNGTKKNMKRIKKLEKIKYNENLIQIKKKNKLLDYIIVNII